MGKRTQRGLAGLAAVAMIAALLTWWLWPVPHPAPGEQNTVAIKSIAKSNKAAPPPRTPQIVPAQVVEPTPDQPQAFARVVDRSEWSGNGMVWCDLSQWVQAPSAILAAELDHGIYDSGSLDPLSRLGAPVLDGATLLSVTKPAGEVHVRVLLTREEAEREADPDGRLPPINLTIRWRGADPGKTVGCDGVWETRTGSVLFVVHDPMKSASEQDEPEKPDFALIRGCGLALPADGVILDTPIEVAPMRCAMHTERRHPGFPLIASRTAPVDVIIVEGEQTTVRLTLPPPPSAYDMPDVRELATAIDIAAFFGADAAADAMEELVDALLNGDLDDLESLQDELSKMIIGERHEGDVVEDFEDPDDIEDMHELDEREVGP